MDKILLCVLKAVVHTTELCRVNHDLEAVQYRSGLCIPFFTSFWLFSASFYRQSMPWFIKKMTLWESS
jgi:hypothetical protein